MESLLSALTAVAGGGITGILGQALTTGLGIFQKKADHKRELAMRRLDLEFMEKEAELAERVKAMDMEQAQSEAEARALEASYAQERTRLGTGSSKLIDIADFVRSMTRPAITILLICLVVIVFFYSGDEQRLEIVNSVVYLASLATSWWFAGRSALKAAK